MARKLTAVLNPDGRGWNFNDAISGETYVSIHIDDLTKEQQQKVLLYGMKQVTADGGAKSKGTSLESRIAGMKKRWGQVQDNDWSFRDGTGTGSLPDGDIYRALIALGFAEDTAARRDIWKGLKPAARRKLGDREDVKAYLAAHSEDDADGDAALEAFAN